MSKKYEILGYYLIVKIQLSGRKGEVPRRF
nr:MAG TPA: hypothetical protein [Caudoviricetes sp.]